MESHPPASSNIIGLNNYSKFWNHRFSRFPCSCYDLPSICSSPSGSHHWGFFLLCLWNSLASCSYALVKKFSWRKSSILSSRSPDIECLRPLGSWTPFGWRAEHHSNPQLGHPHCCRSFGASCDLDAAPYYSIPTALGHVKAWAISFLLLQPLFKWPDFCVCDDDFWIWFFNSEL